MNKKDIVDIVQSLEASGLAELHIKDGEFEMTLRKPEAVLQSVTGKVGQDRNTGKAGQEMDTGMPGQELKADTDNGDSSLHKTTHDAAQESKAEGEIISAPIVGTFYRAPSPDSPPYADEDMEVKEGGTLCIIEAMKVMNELEAEFDCRIKKVLVEDQQMVEYGTPLFEVERLSHSSIE